MNHKFFRYAWLTLIMLSATLACQLVSKIGQTKQEVEAAATEAKKGINMLGTARAMVTQVGGSQMLKTAQAVATEVGESGFLQTAIAVATEERPSAIGTAKAFVTQEGPGLKETAQVAMTQVAGSLDEPPQDIPLVSGDRENFLGTNFMVTYMTTMSFQEVLDFYKSEMPAKGWTKVTQGTVETQDTAALNYEKDNRKAAVTLNVNPLDKKTIVLIVITGE